MTGPNLLYYGDNLDVLRRHVKDETVDLVYLDPPFNSNADYNVLFAEHGEKAAAQIEAFTDTWEWNTEARLSFEEMVEAGGKVADTMRAFRTMLGPSDMLAYLSMMAPRLVELRRVMKVTGSLYLHCDPTASHYLKLLLDAIFEPKNFRAEIIWERAGAHNMRVKGWARTNDSLLFYTKSATFTFNHHAGAALPRREGTRAGARLLAWHRADGLVHLRGAVQPHGLRACPRVLREGAKRARGHGYPNRPGVVQGPHRRAAAASPARAAVCGRRPA